jgi:hypothetical protein
MFEEQQAQTKAFLKLLAQHTTTKIDLHYIHDDTLRDRSTNKKLTIATDISIDSAYKILKEENAWWKNKQRKENVYWSWSKQAFNVAFVDDIISDKADVFRQKRHFCLIQTSQKKFQGFFLLDKYISAENLVKVQKVLQSAYEGDIGAVGAWQLHRLTGFINTKYQDDFVVKIASVGDTVLKVDNILSYYDKLNAPEPKQQAIKRTITKQGRKTWKDFYDEDKSQADFRYALYLLHFYSPKEVYNILEQESPDLNRRKGAYTNDYLMRTIEKAQSFFV